MGSQNARITVVIADDQEVAREGIRQMLASAPDIEIIGVAKDGGTVQALVAQLLPQVLLLDLGGSGLSSAEIALWAHEHHPEIAMLVLTEQNHDHHLVQMVDAGVAGYLDKGVRAPQLIAAIRAVASGQVLLTREQLQRARRWRSEVLALWGRLTPREQEVLALMCQGQSNQEIAQTLVISEHTVETHVGNLLGKLGVASRTAAVVWALKSGILETCGDSGGFPG